MGHWIKGFRTGPWSYRCSSAQWSYDQNLGDWQAVCTYNWRALQLSQPHNFPHFFLLGCPVCHHISLRHPSADSLPTCRAHTIIWRTALWGFIEGCKQAEHWQSLPTGPLLILTPDFLLQNLISFPHKVQSTHWKHSGRTGLVTSTHWKLLAIHEVLQEESWAKNE